MLSPSGWTTEEDSSGNMYYRNTSTGHTQWEKPQSVQGGGSAGSWGQLAFSADGPVTARVGYGGGISGGGVVPSTQRPAAVVSFECIFPPVSVLLTSLK